MGGFFNALVLLVFGWPLVQAMLFPLLYLLFLVPFGEFLVPHLIDVTGDITVQLVQWTGIPVYREGNAISLPTGNWQVVEACSGIRYLIALIALGAYYAYLTYRTWFKRLLFILFCMLLAILANGLRAFGIVMVGHFSNMQYATGVDHIIYGWLFFGVLCFVLFWLGNFWRDAGSSAVDDRGHPAPLPVQTNAGLPMLLAALLLLVAWYGQDRASAFVDASQRHFRPVQAAEGWQQQSAATNWHPQFAGATFEQQQTFAKAGQSVFVYLNRYYNQLQGQEMISAGNQVYNAEQFAKRISEQRLTEPYAVLEKVLANATETQVIWYWYVVGGQSANHPITGKLLQLWAILSGRQSETGVIVLMVQQSSQEPVATARRTLATFISEMAQPLQQPILE